jgi:hypothetical protein
MGLQKYLEKKFGSRESDDPHKRWEKAQELKQRQEEYEAEEKAYKSERIRRASAKGREKAKGGDGIFKTFSAIGDFGTGMAKSFGANMFMPPKPKPKPQVKKQVVVVRVVGAGGATKHTRRRSHPRRKHPFEL